MSEQYSLLKACTLASEYSKKYLTHWYVRDVGNNLYSPWAHSSDDEKTVACYYCGYYCDEARDL